MYYFHKIIGCRPEGPKSPPPWRSHGQAKLVLYIKREKVGMLTCKLSLKGRKFHDLGGVFGRFFSNKKHRPVAMHGL